MAAGWPKLNPLPVDGGAVEVVVLGWPNENEEVEEVVAADAVPKAGAEAGVLEADGKLKPPVVVAGVLEVVVDPPKLKAGAEEVVAAEAPKPWGAEETLLAVAPKPKGAEEALVAGLWPKLKVVPVPWAGVEAPNGEAAGVVFPNEKVFDAGAEVVEAGLWPNPRPVLAAGVVEAAPNNGVEEGAVYQKKKWNNKSEWRLKTENAWKSMEYLFIPAVPKDPNPLGFPWLPKSCEKQCHNISIHHSVKPFLLLAI